MEVHRPRVLPAVSGTQGACRGGNSGPGGSGRRDCAKIVRACGYWCEAGGRPRRRTAIPVDLRVSLTGVTAILARLAGRRSERMPRLAQQPDRRFALVCRRPISPSARPICAAHDCDGTARARLLPLAGQRSCDPRPRIHRYALGYHKLEARSSSGAWRQTGSWMYAHRTVPAERRTARPAGRPRLVKPLSAQSLPTLPSSPAFPSLRARAWFRPRPY